MQTKNVRVTLRSIIDNLSETGLPTNDREEAESAADGTLSIGERGSVIDLTEDSEGGRINTRIEIVGDKIRVRRHGAIESDLLFSEGMAHSSVYGAPPYSFDTNIFTRRIRGGITEEGGKIDIFYDMEIGGAKKSVKMTVACSII